MIEETIQDFKDNIEKAREALHRELAKLRTGRANPALLDRVRVDYYGSMTPLKQLASISVPEARMLVIKPFDRSQIQAVEKAIMDAQLGLNPMNDGEIIRLPIPPLTEERRRDITKMARTAGEDCKVSIRQSRREANDMIDLLKKDGDIGEDAARRAKEEVDELVKAASATVDETVSKKEADIMAV